MAAECDSNFIREEGAKSVVHQWGKSHIEGHLPNGQDDTSTVEEGILIVGGVT